MKHASLHCSSPETEPGTSGAPRSCGRRSLAPRSRRGCCRRRWASGVCRGATAPAWRWTAQGRCPRHGWWHSEKMWKRSEKQQWGDKTLKLGLNVKAELNHQEWNAVIGHFYKPWKRLILKVFYVLPTQLQVNLKSQVYVKSPETETKNTRVKSVKS